MNTKNTELKFGSVWSFICGFDDPFSNHEAQQASNNKANKKNKLSVPSRIARTYSILSNFPQPQSLQTASLTHHVCVHTDNANSSCLADCDPRKQAAGCAEAAAMSSRHKFYHRVATGLFKCAAIYRSMSTHVIALPIIRMLASQEIGTLQFDSSSDSFGRKVRTEKRVALVVH
jgi:hypothetical protein